MRYGALLALTLALAAGLAALPARAQSPDIGAIVTGHVLPGYRRLAAETETLAEAASRDCSPDNPELPEAYHAAFDAWIRVSHLRFGPSETGDRAFALAFWPDPRGATPKALAGLIRNGDPAVETATEFATVSVAARGFHALDYLLYDPQFAEAGDTAYRCRLIGAVTGDIAANASAILEDWEASYAGLMTTQGNDRYRTPEEATKQLFTALLAGLEFTSDTRLGRPLGSFDRPRPNRAEARRSGRSLRHVVLSLEATRDLASRLTGNDPEVDAAFAAALDRARALEDPVFAGVAEPQGRLRVEALQRRIGAIRSLLAEQVGPRLGIAAGFNSLDGD